MSECAVCLQEPAVDSGKCQRCADWEAYWRGLTEAEREEELRAMAIYASESDE